MCVCSDKTFILGSVFCWQQLPCYYEVSLERALHFDLSSPVVEEVRMVPWVEEVMLIDCPSVAVCQVTFDLPPQSQ